MNIHLSLASLGSPANAKGHILEVLKLGVASEPQRAWDVGEDLIESNVKAACLIGAVDVHTLFVVQVGNDKGRIPTGRLALDKLSHVVPDQVHSEPKVQCLVHLQSKGAVLLVRRFALDLSPSLLLCTRAGTRTSGTHD